MTRFQFVADHRHAFDVKRLCQTVEIARSSFYAWEAGAPARAVRQAADRRPEGAAERDPSPGRRATEGPHSARGCAGCNS